MLLYTVYNSNTIRKRYKFTNYNDPNILEKDILRIINNQMDTNFKVLDFSNPILANYKVQFMSSDNPSGWGIYDLYTAYMNTCNCIKNMKTTNNFIVKLESIYVDPNCRYRCFYKPKDITGPKEADMAYDITYNFISNNFTNCLSIMNRVNKRLIVFHIEDPNGGLMSYILSVGFDPYDKYNVDYFNTSHNPNSMDRNSYMKYSSLRCITRYKLGNTDIVQFNGGNYVSLDHNTNKLFSTYDKCLEFVNSLNMVNMNKGIYDGNYKYENFIPDINVENYCNNCKPGVLYLFEDYKGNSYELNKFTHIDKRIDYNYFKNENLMIAN